MLSENRELYDLCRKYKYYYNSYKQVEKLKKIYWSKYIQEAYNEIETEIKNIEKEIMFLIFDELLDEWSSIDFEKDMVTKYDFMSACISERVTITDNKFIAFMKDYVRSEKFKGKMRL